MNNLISVIVPVYNVELYLERCLTSIINQTYKNLDIILIDDGSSDKSGKICDSYATKDKRIRCIHTNNRGLSEARNLGIKSAKGDYLTFVDSDDYISSKYVEHLCSILEKYGADLSITREKKIYGENENIEHSIFNDQYTKVYDSENALQDMLYRKNIPVYAWAKLYKKELFDCVEFPKGEIFEDLSTTYLLFDAAKVISYNPVRDYCYIQRENSIINSSFKSEKMIQIDITEKIVSFISEKYPQIVGAAVSKCFITTLNLYRNIPSGSMFKKNRETAKIVIKKYRWKVLKNSKEKKLTRIIAFLSLFNIRMFRFLGIIYQFLISKEIIKMKRPL